MKDRDFTSARAKDALLPDNISELDTLKMVVGV